MIHYHDDIEQGSAEWFALRCGVVTASKASDALSSGAATRTKYLRQIVSERLTRQKAPSYSNDAMQWGIDHEDEARTLYALLTGNQVIETGFVTNDGLPQMGVSPDGLIGDDGMLEIKAPNSSTHLEYLERGKIPARYVAQVQMQLLVTERAWCDFVSFDPRFPPKSQIAIYRTPRDDEYIRDKLAPGLQAFLTEANELHRRYA